jgi:hypothetical protein
MINVLGVFLIPNAAFPHHAEWMKGKPFIQGLSMPVHGLDHVLVTFAVGLIAVQIGGYFFVASGFIESIWPIGYISEPPVTPRWALPPRVSISRAAGSLPFPAALRLIN